MSELNVVRLRDGSEVPTPAVVTIGLTVERLMQEHPLAFWELIEVCRKPEHVIFSEPLARELERRSLVQPVREGTDLRLAKPHQLISEVVRNMVEGELPDIRLVNPLASGEAV